MTNGASARTAPSCAASGAAGEVAPSAGLTIYGCEPDEALMFRQMAARFGVTPSITAAPLTESNLQLACGNRCVSVSHKSPITGRTLFALRQAGVKYLSTRSVGYNHIDLHSAERFGICVENVAYSPDGVADFTLMLMLMALRNAKAALSRAQLHDYRLNEVRGKELRDLTVGVIGTGCIGAAVIERVRGFGARVLAHDRCRETSAEYVTLDVLLQKCDVVTLHVPLTEDTHHLLNRWRIDQMRNGAFIINTGRGALLDTEGLLDALERGHLGGAALDVLEGEEGVFYADHREKPIENLQLLRLQQLPNVLITPHTAYYTDHALSDTVENTIRNCMRFERTGPWVG